MQKLFS